MADGTITHHSVFYSAGTEFLRAVGLSVLIYATGILNAPDKTTAVALSIAALFGSLAAGFRVLQKFVPLLSWKRFIKNVTVAAWADAFTRAFLASLLITITGWLAAPDLTTWKSVGLSAVIGALMAGVRALQGLVTPGENPLPGKAA